MKTILLLLIPVFAVCQTGPSFSVCKITPIDVCIGDSAEIHYRYYKNLTVAFYTVTIKAVDFRDTVILWQGSDVKLYVYPYDEDSCRVMKVKIPCGFQHGFLTIISPRNTFDFFAKECGWCQVGIKEHSSDQLNPVYYDLYGNKTEKLYNQAIIERSDRTRKIVILRNQ